jgi:alkylhydroperoxidase family enzyme
MFTFLLLAALLAAPSQAKNISMTGIPYVTDDDKAGPPDLLAAIRARRPGGKLLNLDRMLLQSPSFAKGWNGMFAAIRGQLALPGKLRELPIMAIAVMNKADYEWVQHEPEFLKAGGTKEQLAALKELKADPGLFDPAELAALQLTTEMTRDVQIKQATIDKLRSLLPDQQVVELIGTIAGYNMVSRFLIATGVEVESTQ